MNANPIPNTLGVVLALMGCADRTQDSVISIPLIATSHNAGEIGRAFLIPRGTETGVVVEVSGVPPQFTSRPVHLYTFLYEGRCDSLPPKPAHALTDRVLAQRGSTAGATPASGPFTISNTVAMSLESLRRGGYAIVIRTSPADGNVEIFCGAIDVPHA
jgi:hypothetical protein